MQNLLKYRDLFWQLTFREMRARYKQSILGYAWAVVVPLINLLILSIVFSNLFKVPTNGIPYPIYLFVALVPWIFMSNALSFATGSIVANSSLITKVNLPREILPIAGICAKIIDLILTSIILIFFLIYFGIGLQPTIVLVPFIFLIQLLLLTGVALILSATNVFYRDIENILGVFLSLWMYLTPIVYSPELIPDNLKIIFYLNPMTPIINAYRDTILFGRFPQPIFLYSVVISIATFFLGYIYFKNRSRYFADVI